MFHPFRPSPALLPILLLSSAAIAQSPSATPQDQTPPTTTPTPTPAPKAAPPAQRLDRTIVESLTQDAANVTPLVTSGAAIARAWLDAAKDLPLPTARVVYRSKDKASAISGEAFDKLPDDQRNAYTRREYPPEFYYLTGYGSPIMYARPLDLYAQAAKPESLANLKIVDFGYGTIAPLRQLASLGAHAHGIDVEPLFAALYSQPTDTGPIPPAHNSTAKSPGTITLHTGRWPADESIKKAVGVNIDLFISKNTLKRGYIHPARDVDPKFLVHLGVDDTTFIKSVFDALKPGGIFLIYNLSPKQNPADKPYLPHADGESPFTKADLEKAGFEVLAFDVDDRDTALKYWMALGFNAGKPESETRDNLFAWYTICRRPK